MTNSRIAKTCELCGCPLKFKKSHDFIRAKFGKLVCDNSYAQPKDDCSSCWKKSGDPIKVGVKKSVHKIKFKNDNQDAIDLLFKLAEQHGKGQIYYSTFLTNLSDLERGKLLLHAKDPLKLSLSEHFEELGLSVNIEQTFVIPDIPENLPEGIRNRLIEFRDRLVKRVNLKIKNNHEIAPRIVQHRMYEPIRLAKYLAKKGHEDWNRLSKQDFIGYLAEFNPKDKAPLLRFFKFLNPSRPVFSKLNFSVGRSGTGVIVEVDEPEIISKAEIKSYLHKMEEQYDVGGFLPFWLVGKMGLTFEKALRLTLNDMKIESGSNVLIKPNLVWLSLPKRINKLFFEYLSARFSEKLLFETHNADLLASLKIFDGYTKAKRNADVNATVLRRSAIFYLMQDKFRDRVTLRDAIGVSLPTLQKLESLMHVNMHRKLDPQLVNARNSYLFENL